MFGKKIMMVVLLGIIALLIGRYMLSCHNKIYPLTISDKGDNISDMDKSINEGMAKIQSVYLATIISYNSMLNCSHDIAASIFMIYIWKQLLDDRMLQRGIDKHLLPKFDLFRFL